MAKYKAVFEAPATVHVVFELEAASQEEGLVAAHDMVLSAGPDTARVVHMDLEAARNIDFSRVEGMVMESSHLPPSPLANAGRCTVRYFSTLDSNQEPVAVTRDLPVETATALAESVLGSKSLFGCAEVLDECGQRICKVNAPRGGYEVEVHYNNGAPVERFSWLSKPEAVKVAIELSKSRKDVKCICIIDYTDRSREPVTIRTIQ